MANGEPIWKTIDRIEQQQLRMEKKLDRMFDVVASINSQGCAQRGDDISRIEKLEDWRDRGIAGIIILAVGIILQFFGLKDYIPQ